MPKPIVIPDSFSNIVGISHKNTRQFKPQHLSTPRDFVLPIFVSAKSAQDNGKPIDTDKPLVLEIGAGKGHHAIGYAQQNPEHRIIAIERTSAKFKAFKKQVDAMSINNLLAVHADAIPYTVHALTPQSLDKVFILYPNPEMRNPNQQWLNMPFFEFLLSRLKPQGQIILATNIKPYMDNAAEQATAVWQLPTEVSQVPIGSTRTHFETKYLQRGETCWQLNLTKPVGYRTRFDRWLSELLI